MAFYYTVPMTAAQIQAFFELPHAASCGAAATFCMSSVPDKQIIVVVSANKITG